MLEEVRGAGRHQAAETLHPGPVPVLVQNIEAMAEVPYPHLVVFELCPARFEVPGQSRQCRLRRRVLDGRADEDLVELSRRPLVIRVERTQGVHGVAEQLDANGLRGVGRKDVDDSPAARNFAGSTDRIHPAVSQAQGLQDEPVRRGTLAGPHDGRPRRPLVG